MPTYTMECKRCQHEWEILASISLRPRAGTRCPNCKSIKTIRTITGANIIPDTFDKPLCMTQTMLPVKSRDIHAQEYVNSRTEYRAYIDAHNKRWGTNLENAK